MNRYAKVAGIGDARATIPTPKQLEKINALSRRPLVADEVYVGYVDLANDQVDRVWEWFPEKILRQFARSAPGSAMLVGHDYLSAPIGTFFDAEIVETNGVKWLRTYYYIPKTSQNEHDRTMLDTGVYRYASIGFGPADHGGELKLICDICGNSYWWSEGEQCPHWPGEEYEIEGETVRATFHYEGKAQMVEGSIVYLGAQYDAQFKAGEQPAREALEEQASMTAMLHAAAFQKSFEGVSIPRQRKDSQSVESAGMKPWEETENEYQQRVRNPDDFRDDTFRSKTITSGEKTIRLILGKLKPDKVPEDGDPDSMVLQALRFPKDDWTLEEAKAWYAAHKDELEKMADEIDWDEEEPEKSLASEPRPELETTIEIKRGRVLNAANEEKIRAAIATLEEVLASLKDEGEQEEAPAPEVKVEPEAEPESQPEPEKQTDSASPVGEDVITAIARRVAADCLREFAGHFTVKTAEP